MCIRDRLKEWRKKIQQLLEARAGLRDAIVGDVVPSLGRDTAPKNLDEDDVEPP